MAIEVIIDSKDALRALSTFTEDVSDEIKKSLDSEFTDIVKEAKQIHRFRNRTGRLLSAVQKEIKGYTASALIQDGRAPHGKFIHDGFKSWAPDPFLEDAFRRNERGLIKALSDSVEKLIKKLRLN